MNILLAEDDARLGELIVHMLKRKAGYQVDWVMTGNDACDYALASHYDVIIMDWMMPDGNGVDACRTLRKSGYSGAILMLTAKDSLEDRVEGLDAGADDYLIKPFEIAELLARLRALSRRNYAPITEEVVHFQDMKLNRTGYSVQQGGVMIQLTPREFQLLDLLAHNKGQVLTREVILDRIWGYDTDVSAKIVDATVKLLRKKLEPFGSEELIQSIRGVGYKLEG
ncbi:response regulator transcription factor [Paenibacillus periandrae]|uniref:response regulator transcription factor n=1 Tax=Paenibacillus periandrae TaxID=1761741 RepID=UPI001F09CF42|nr:response regulator transcription factor [Paenibacillus periandrae]